MLHSKSSNHSRKVVFGALLLGAAALFQAPGTARAQTATPLFNLYNTGVNPGINAAPDASYTVGVQGSGVSAAAFRTDMNTYPVQGAYTPTDSATSGFISPQAVYTNLLPGDLPNTTYEFSTSFDLTGYDPSAVSIQANLEADDYITNILINGNATGFSTTRPSFTAFTAFDVSGTGLLQAGVNTIQFEVFNTEGVLGNPVAFRAEYTTAIPEPSTYAMIAGLGVLCFVGSRLRRASVA